MLDTTTDHVPALDPFHDLLNNPPGDYGLTPWGRTTAVSLTGCPVFCERAFTLFTSFGGERTASPFREHRTPTVHVSERPDTIWFCMPAERIKSALRLYLFGQIARAAMVPVYDAEGELVEMTCPDEEALWERAEQLACDFIVQHMTRDWGALPKDDWSTPTRAEHSIGNLSDGSEAA